MKYFDSENSSRSVAVVPVDGDVLTLSAGTTGTANINVNGVAYLATFATSLTVTAANWVALHRDALLLRGIRCTSAAAVITFVHKRPHIVTNRVSATLSGASDDLAATIAGTFTPDFNLARKYQLAISCPVTVAKALHAKDGQNIQLDITAAGAFAVTWNAAYQFIGGTEHTQTSTSLDILKGNYNAAADKVYLTVEASDVKA